MNRDYAKLVNGRIQYPKDREEWPDSNGDVHTTNNPKPDKLLELGYLPVRRTEPPNELVEGKHYESAWEQTEKEILQTWHLVDDPVYPDPEPTIADLEQAIERGLNS